MNAKTKPTTYTSEYDLPDDQRKEYGRELERLEAEYIKAMKPFDRMRDAAYKTSNDKLIEQARDAFTAAVLHFSDIYQSQERELEAKYHIIEPSFIPR